MKESLEDFLKRMQAEQGNEDLGLSFEEWTQQLGFDLLISYAEKWHVEQEYTTISGAFLKK